MIEITVLYYLVFILFVLLCVFICCVISIFKEYEEKVSDLTWDIEAQQRLIVHLMQYLEVDYVWESEDSKNYPKFVKRTKRGN